MSRTAYSNETDDCVGMGKRFSSGVDHQLSAAAQSLGPTSSSRQPPSPSDLSLVLGSRPVGEPGFERELPGDDLAAGVELLEKGRAFALVDPG